MFNLNFVIEDKTMLADINKIIEQRRKQFLKDAGDMTVKTLREFAAPAGVTHKFAPSMTKQVGSDDVAMFSTDDPAKVLTLEGGRRAGAAPPPVSALLPWVSARLGGGPREAYMLARAISVRGQKGRFTFERTWQEIQGPATNLAEGIIEGL